VSTTHPEILEQTPPAQHHDVTRRSTVLIAILALLVGGVGGFFIGWAAAPTKTVTATVTRTVAPPAYATSKTQTAYVTFDGTRGYYNGPTEVPAGTSLSVHFAGPVGSAMSIASLATGTKLEDMTPETRAHGNPPPSVTMDLADQVGPGAVTVQLGSGTYLVVAGTSRTLPPSVITMIRAVG